MITTAAWPSRDAVKESLRRHCDPKQAGTVDPFRNELVDRFLDANRLKGWLAWRPDELVMLAGHQPHWGVSFLLVLRSGERVLFAPEGEPPIESAGLTERRFPWGDMRVADPFGVLSKMLQSELETRGLSAGDIGCMPQAHRYAPAEVASEQCALPAAVIEQMTEDMRSEASLHQPFLSLFLIKTEAELERIELANRVALAGLSQFRQSIETGASEAEIAADVERAIHRHTGAAGIRSARGWAMVQAGPNTAQSGRYNRSSGYRVKEGDLVLIELATCVNGYWSDLTLTVPAGPATPRAAELLGAVGTAREAALSVVRDGALAADVDSAARESLRAAGLAQHFTHATGHHVGFRYHDPGFALMPAADGAKDILREGMVITIEPGVYLQDEQIGVRQEHNVAVTRSGARILSLPRGAGGAERKLESR